MKEIPEESVVQRILINISFIVIGLALLIGVLGAPIMDFLRETGGWR